MAAAPRGPSGMNWAKITPEYYDTLRDRGDRPVQAIVRVADRADRYRDELASRGFEIRRLFTLIPGLAVTGPGSRLLELLKEPWVMSIEPDRPVYIASSE